VAATEACLADAAALGATYPAAAGGRAWSGLRPGIDAESPRGALAAAIGASISGQRSTVFLSGPDLAAGADLVALAVGQRSPLVIHLAARATSAHAQALGSGHEAYHAAADCGAMALFAVNVQEAADLALIGRRAAERALVPCVVAMDAEQTALAVQDVCLPDANLIREFVGEAHGRIEAPTDAQRFIFGDTRRLVPRLYDLERPMMLAPLQGPESWALGAAARGPYFDRHVPALLDEALAEFAQRTGRRYGRIHEHRLDGAEIVIVCQGSAVETATAVADRARADDGARVGVLGVRCLRPFPAEMISQALKGIKTIAVLDRAGDGPLLRELRAALGDRHRFIGVTYGHGGLPLRAADLAALLRRIESPQRERVYLGLEFTRKTSAFPKHQALLDALRRAEPDLEALGLRSTEPPPAVRPQGAVTIAIHRLAGQAHQTLAGEAAALIHAAFGGSVRSRPALTWQRFDEPCADVITHAPEALLDPGDDVPVDIAVVAAETAHGLLDPTERLVADGLLLMPGPGGAEALLGGLLALVSKRTGRELSAARARALRAETLADVPEAERAQRVDAFAAAFETARAAEVAGAPAGPPADVSPPEVEGLGRSDVAVGSLPRFWDHAGVFYRTGRTEELVADPCSAVGAIPPLSASFRNVSGGRATLAPTGRSRRS
jgi:pyruvate-ferredoxin/flavodoxin oxidoreductase